MQWFHRQQSLDSHQIRDKTKAELCNEKGKKSHCFQDLTKHKGITLIEVPYWWDRKLSSLEATLYNTRPDLFQVQPQGIPIPATPPSTETTTKTKGTKALMTATEWDKTSMDPKGWYMTEKYDGMRLYWNGNQFYSRQGEKVHVPESIASKFPSISLDGELW